MEVCVHTFTWCFRHIIIVALTFKISFSEDVAVSSYETYHVKLHLHGPKLCKGVFKKLSLMSLPPFYVYKLILFVIQKLKLYGNTCQHLANTPDQNQCFSNLATEWSKVLKQGPYYVGMNLFNALPNNIKVNVNENNFH